MLASDESELCGSCVRRVAVMVCIPGEDMAVAELGSAEALQPLISESMDLIDQTGADQMCLVLDQHIFWSGGLSQSVGVSPDGSATYIDVVRDVVVLVDDLCSHSLRV